MHESSETIDPRLAADVIGPRERPIPIGPEVAEHVLFHFGEGGYRPGSFLEKLIIAIAGADDENQLRLALGFPEYVTAVQLAQYSATGIAALRGFAQAGPTDEEREATR